MERIFINTNFKYIHVVPIQNGDSWTPEQLANQIATKFYVLNVVPEIIVVWLDREVLDRSPDELRLRILDALIEKGANGNSIHICVPDLMTENIILADEHVIRETFALPAYEYSYESTNGKVRLREMYRNIGNSYRETSEGVLLLKKIRLSRAAEKCPAAQRFLETFTGDCWWIAPQN